MPRDIPSLDDDEAIARFLNEWEQPADCSFPPYMCQSRKACSLALFLMAAGASAKHLYASREGELEILACEECCHAEWY